MGLRADVVDGADALAATEGSWRSLAVAAGNAFLTPEWFTAWWRHYGRDTDVRVAVVREPDGAIAGLLPVSVEGPALRVAGSNVADLTEPLARPGRLLEVARAAGAALAAAYPRAHLVLTNVDQDAAWVPALASGWPSRLVRSPVRHDVLPHLPLPSSWEELLAARSRNFRNQVGRKERNLVSRHGARFRAADDPARLPADMNRFFALHEARWGGHGGVSSMSGPTVAQFHAEFAAAALDRGWLRLWFLEADGQEVAAIYGWTVGRRACYFNAGWDPRWSATSVGLVLLAHAVRSAVSEGAEDYDFLLGDEQYKYRFATEERAVESVVLARPLSSAGVGLRVDRGLRRAGRVLPPQRRAQLEAALAPALRRVPGGRRR